MGPMSAPDSIAELRSAVNQAASVLRGGEPAGPEPSLDRPPKPNLGDYSSNAAMLLAAPLGEKPRDVAERLRAELERDLGVGENIDRIEVAGPGFLNLFLSDAWYRRAMSNLVAGGDRLGPAPTDSPERILVEFVSANPTGPLHVGGGRHAAYGDALVRLLEAVGHDVTREFYVNDAGGQVERFATSIIARINGAEPPEDGYEGAYVGEIGKRIAAEGIDTADTEAVGRRGVELVLEGVRTTLDRFGVHFDSWFSERTLYERGEVEAALAQLQERGHSYKSEDALWLRTTTFGDDKDRVLIRANGEPTYLAADVAYHWDKLERGFGRLIDVLGADHHGYVPRLRAAIAELGADPDAFEALDHAPGPHRRGWRAHPDVEAQRRFRLPRRAARRHRHRRQPLVHAAPQPRHDSRPRPRAGPPRVQREPRLLRAVRPRQDLEHPAQSGGGGGRQPPIEAEAPDAPLEAAEKALIKRLLEFPEEVREAAARRAPHRICSYSMTVAADFHAFYRDCLVIGAEGAGVERSRLALCLLTKRTIAEALGLLGISAPERM